MNEMIECVGFSQLYRMGKWVEVFETGAGTNCWTLNDD